MVLGKEVVKLPKKTPLGKINSDLNSRDIAKVVSLSQCCTKIYFDKFDLKGDHTATSCCLDGLAQLKVEWPLIAYISSFNPFSNDSDSNGSTLVLCSAFNPTRFHLYPLPDVSNESLNIQYLHIPQKEKPFELPDSVYLASKSQSTFYLHKLDLISKQFSLIINYPMKSLESDQSKWFMTNGPNAERGCIWHSDKLLQWFNYSKAQKGSSKVF